MKKKIFEEIRVNIEYKKLSEIIKVLEDTKEKYGDLILELEYDFDYDDSPLPYAAVSIEREETDKEYQERLEKEEKARVYRKAQYEALKKEFG